MCRLQPENVFLISIVFFKLVDPREGERERVCVTERECVCVCVCVCVIERQMFELVFLFYFFRPVTLMKEQRGPVLQHQEQQSRPWSRLRRHREESQ